MGLTLFHDATIGPDVFVANCSIQFEDLTSSSDIWIDLEPEGKIHLVIDLKPGEESSEINEVSASAISAASQPLREFKERSTGLNRRRGAMRRRVR